MRSRTKECKLTLHAVVVFWLKQTKQRNTEKALPQYHHKRELENLNFTGLCVGFALVFGCFGCVVSISFGGHLAFLLSPILQHVGMVKLRQYVLMTVEPRARTA